LFEAVVIGVTFLTPALGLVENLHSENFIAVSILPNEAKALLQLFCF